MRTWVRVVRLGWGLLGGSAGFGASRGEGVGESVDPAPTGGALAAGALDESESDHGDPCCGAGGDRPRDWAVSVRWENDTFGGTDRFYTDGVSVSVIHRGAGWLEGFADWLPWGDGQRSVGYDVGQIIVTSGDKLMAFPDPLDRPYAGALLAGLTLHVERGRCYHGLKLIAGVVGPWSFAEETQIF